MQFDELRELDQNDPLNYFRDQFHIPRENEKELIYFCGNSLGLQPKRTSEYLNLELKAWREKGVKGHFTGRKPWVSYHELAKNVLSHLVGARPTEVQAVGSLTSNLHLLLSSFYQPKGKRIKVIIESGAFPSDFYAMYSHMSIKGVNPVDHLIELKAKNEKHYLPTEEIIEKITEIGDELALVLMPGVQYYTGQFFDIKKITTAAHAVGSYVGFDLAHAIGNLPLNLHGDETDFAVWCSYKYLNSGPGGIGGMFIHEKHAINSNFPRLSGWWGHDAKDRFKMTNEISPIPTIDGWQLSSTNVLSTAAHLASLAIFEKVGIEQLRAKSIRMIHQLEIELIKLGGQIEIITPNNPKERGCQLSIFMKKVSGRKVFDYLDEHGIVADWREPNVIRITPVPLYNTFLELGRFIEIFKKAID